jgi:hypothetical protein
VRLEVFEASPATLELADRIEERWGRMASQDRTEDIGIPVHAGRELRADPTYVPSFRPEPARHRLEVELTDDEQAPPSPSPAAEPAVAAATA